MISFIDEKGKRHSAQTVHRIRHGVNGEKSITGTIYTNDAVIQQIDRGWRLVANDEYYNITFALPKDYGDTIEVEFDAVHEFFYDFAHDVVYGTLNGSNTFKAYLDFIFAGSGYTYSLNTTASAFERQDFGNKLRLSLFNDVIKAAGVEFNVFGRVVRIVDAVGSDLTTKVEKRFNMQELRLEKHINEFITYKRGLGAWVDDEDKSLGRLEVEYESPLAQIYGRLHGEPVVDERYSVAANLQSRLQDEVENSYSISVTLDMEDLTRSGYDYPQPRAGDWIMAINDDLGFRQRIRIVSYESSYDINGDLIKHDVTCNSIGLVARNQNDPLGLASKIDAVGDKVDKVEGAIGGAIEGAIGDAIGGVNVDFGQRLQDAKDEWENMIGDVEQSFIESIRDLEGDVLEMIENSGGGRLFFGNTNPSTEYDLRTGDTWYDTSGAETIVKYWNGTTWVRMFNFDEIYDAIDSLESEIGGQLDAVGDAIYEIINNAAGTGRLFYGGIDPTTQYEIRVGDVWFDSSGEFTVVKHWNGYEWVRSVDMTILENRIAAAEDETETVRNNLTPVITQLNDALAAGGEISLTDLFARKIAEEDFSTLFFQSAKDIGLTYEEDGVTRAIIAISDGVPYIAGENIILDGNTTVDGTFTVTEQMIAPEAIIGHLVAEGIDADNITVTNLDMENISGAAIELTRGFKITRNGNPVLDIDAATGEVVMNVDSLLINEFSPVDDTVHTRDLQSYLRFNNGIVEIGERGADVKTQFGNDEWAMVRNNQKLMWLEQDIINIQKAHFFERMQVGNFGFVPRSNGSLDLRKVVD